MSKPTDTPDIGRLDIEDDTEDLFASPSTSGANTQKHTPTSNTSSAHQHQQQSHKRSQSESRDVRLRAELERVKEVNRVIEGVTSSLEKAKANMGTVQRTVENASTLLATWTRILSQTEHNQRLILNPNWQGATQDVEDMENEELRRHQEAERRAAEEQRRKEEAQRRAEEEERRRTVAPSTGTRGTGRVRSSRGAPAVRGTRAHAGVGGAGARGRGTSSTGSRGSGIGRGTSSSTRSRGRGLG